MNIKDHQEIRVLFTGGRAPVTLDLVRFFSKAGHLVYVADCLDHYLTKSSNKVEKSFIIKSPVDSYDQFIQDLQQIIQENKIDLLIPTCEEIFYIAKGKDILAEECMIFCEDLPILHQLHHKYNFIQYVKELGLPVPKTYLVQTGDECKKAVELINDDVVLKPVYSRFGTNVEFIKKDDKNHCFRKGLYVVQEEIKGKTICNYSILYQGKIKATANYEVNYTAGQGASIQFQHVSHEKIKKWLEQFFRESNLTGQFAFDFIETETGELYVIECNPRTTSGVHLFQDLNIVDSFFGLNNKTLEPLPETKRMIGLAMLVYGVRSGKLLTFFRDLMTSKDIIWSKIDIKPWFYQFYTYLHILSKGRDLKISAMEASTVDIEWNGGD